MNVPIIRVRPEADADIPVPRYQTDQSAGIDLHAAVDAQLEPKQTALIPTGFAIALPPDYEGQVRPRSGLALKHGVTLLNSPGTIDADYRGEIKVILINHSEQIFTIRRLDRIAQLVIAPVVRVVWELVSTLPQTNRGSGGFGHSGI